MPVRPAQSPFEPCPFINLGHARCAAHFTLSHLSQAFGDCLGDYRRCSHYQRLSASTYPPAHLPTHGHALQPTGS